MATVISLALFLSYRDSRVSLLTLKILMNYLHIGEYECIGACDGGVEPEDALLLLPSAEDDSVVRVQNEEVNQFVRGGRGSYEVCTSNIDGITANIFIEGLY